MPSIEETSLTATTDLPLGLVLPPWLLSPWMAAGLIFLGLIILSFFHPARTEWKRTFQILHARPAIWMIPAVGAALHGLIYFFHHQPPTGTTTNTPWPTLSSIMPQAAQSTLALFSQQSFLSTAPYGLSAVLLLIALLYHPQWLKKLPELDLRAPRWLQPAVLYPVLAGLLLAHGLSWLFPHDRLWPHPLALLHALIVPFFFAYLVITGFTLSRAPAEGQDQHLLTTVALSRWPRVWPHALATLALAFINPIGKNLPWPATVGFVIIALFMGYFMILCILQDQNPPLSTLLSENFRLLSESFFSLLWSLLLLSVPLFLAVMLTHYLHHAPIEKSLQAIGTALGFATSATALTAFTLHWIITCEHLTRTDE
jgi:hypothetical protein